MAAGKRGVSWLVYIDHYCPNAIVAVVVVCHRQINPFYSEWPAIEWTPNDVGLSMVGHPPSLNDERMQIVIAHTCT